jgi:hypothetical protein
MTDIPMKFAIPILAVVALPLLGALYNFATPAPQLMQAHTSAPAQTNDNKFVATLRATNEDPCTHAAMKINVEAYRHDLDVSGDCHVTYKANKTEAHVELEVSEGVFRFTYVADAVRLPEDMIPNK